MTFVYYLHFQLKVFGGSACVMIRKDTGCGYDFFLCIITNSWQLTC